MKTASLALAIAVVAAGPALAKPANVVQPSHHQHSQPADSHALATKHDPYGVYIDGREVGRDPDPNIRRELENEYFWG